MKQNIKRIITTLGLGLLFANSYSQAQDIKKDAYISKIETRPSLIVNKTPYKGNFSGGEVRVDWLFPKSDAKTHSAAYVTFEPGARSNWHNHPKGQHLIVTSGVGYTQFEGKTKVIIKEGDVVWCPPDIKHWHGASKDIAMTHIAVSGAKNGKSVTWFEKVTDEEYLAE